jgi:hypothetical protein
LNLERKTFRSFTVKIQQAICVSIGLFIGAQLSLAQSFNVYAGVGTAIDGSSNQQINTFGTGSFTTPKLAGAFPDIGVSVMFTKHFGVGADVSWRASKAAYAGLLERPLFYNFDGVWTPVSTKHFEPELRAGIGGMRMGFSYDQTECDPFGGCTTSNQSVESSNHFQGHFAAAARFYLTDRVFIRPAVDTHVVANLFQFGHDVVPQYSIGIGYSFGRE